MSKLGGRQSWKKHRLADRLVVDGCEYAVDLVARKGTGTTGYRVTVVFLNRTRGRDVEVELPSAPSTADVHRSVRELSEDPDRLIGLLHSGRKT